MIFVPFAVTENQMIKGKRDTSKDMNSVIYFCLRWRRLRTFRKWDGFNFSHSWNVKKKVDEMGVWEIRYFFAFDVSFFIILYTFEYSFYERNIKIYFFVNVLFDDSIIKLVRLLIWYNKNKSLTVYKFETNFLHLTRIQIYKILYSF